MKRRTIAISAALAVVGLAALLRPLVLPEGRPAVRPAPVFDTAWAAGPSRSRRGEIDLGDRAIPVASPLAGPVVYVVGAVRRPGVYTLIGGARLVAAVRAAGGFTDAADQAAIDLAAFARDGEQIVVPKFGDPARPVVADATMPQNGDAASATAGVSDVSSGEVAAKHPRRRTHRRGHHRRRRRPAAVDAGLDSQTSQAPSSGDAPVDLNTASTAELQTLPGIGPALADRIVEFRETAGPFGRPEELLDVNGMTDARYAAIAGLVTTGAAR